LLSLAGRGVEGEDEHKVRPYNPLYFPLWSLCSLWWKDVSLPRAPRVQRKMLTTEPTENTEGYKPFTVVRNFSARE